MRVLPNVRGGKAGDARGLELVYKAGPLLSIHSSRKPSKARGRTETPKSTGPPSMLPDISNLLGSGQRLPPQPAPLLE